MKKVTTFGLLAIALSSCVSRPAARPTPLQIIGHPNTPELDWQRQQWAKDQWAKDQVERDLAARKIGAKISVEPEPEQTREPIKPREAAKETNRTTEQDEKEAEVRRVREVTTRLDDNLVLELFSVYNIPNTNIQAEAEMQFKEKAAIVEQEIKKRNLLNTEEWQAVKARQIKIGIPIKVVVAILGTPYKKKTTVDASGAVTEWTFSKFPLTGEFADSRVRILVIATDGMVTKVEF